MSIMLSNLYAALREAGAPEKLAQEAAEEVYQHTNPRRSFVLEDNLLLVVLLCLDIVLLAFILFALIGIDDRLSDVRDRLREISSLIARSR